MTVKIKRQFVPLYGDVHRSKKWAIMAAKHPELYDNLFTALTRIWLICRERYHDGILEMDGPTIELLALWTPERGLKAGKFIEIVTNKPLDFIDKISDSKYHVHKWYFNVPMLDPDKKKDVSEVKAKAANTGHFNKALKALNERGIELDDCDWLYQHENGSMAVNYSELPEQMDLGNETFFTRKDFKNRNKTSDAQQRHNRSIKKHTKRCAKCNSIFISSATDICFGCYDGFKGKT